MKTPTQTKSRVVTHLKREEDESRQEVRSAASVIQTTSPDYSTHTTVFLNEIEQYLEPKEDEWIFDATAGRGGHSFALLTATRANVFAIDADQEAVEATKIKLEKFKARAVVAEGNFGNVEKLLKKQGLSQVQKAIFDLGWNTTQLISGRGFSFLHDEPLSMSYSRKPASGFTAREILNEWDEKTIADVLYGYGEEQYSRGIAKAIIERRKIKPIETTVELAELVGDSVPAGYRKGRIHPATKTFQALRIAVNDELGVLEKGLTGVWKHLSCNGRIAVITFHSIEDRVVKRLFQDLVRNDGGKLVLKKPLVPSRAEIISNPRSRSAKLRVIEKVCIQ